MPKPVDPEVNAFIGSIFSERTDLTDADGPDFFNKFCADAQLAGQFGRNGWRFVDALAESTSDIDRRATEALQKGRAAPASGWNEELTTGAPLTKRYSGVTAAGYRDWLRVQLAKGKTADEAIQKWSSEFPHAKPEVLKALRDVAAELEAV